MGKHPPSIEDRFTAYRYVDAPADLRRRLVAAIRTIDPVVQLDATGCVLAGVLMDEYRLREINAELLAALKDAHFLLGCYATAAMTEEDRGRVNTALMHNRAAIAKAEGQ